MTEEEENKKDKRDSEDRNSSPNERQNKEDKISVWEWITAFIGLALVTGAIGFMLYNAAAGSETPPSVTLRVEKIEQIENGYLVKFSALNKGSETIAEVAIEAELKAGGEKTETKQVTLHYLPSHSVRKGGFFFQNDPRQFDLQMSAVGYEQP